MPRTLASLFVAMALLIGSTHGYARGVHFGVAGPAGFIHQGFPRVGFINRHIFFKSLDASGVVFVPYDDPYAAYPVYQPDTCYVVLP
jgi:hypothetical protein